jgi:5-methylcytosine-specific restriction protein A
MPLTRQKIDVLEDIALRAFLGKSRRIKDGIEIRNEFGPVATICWTNLQPGNDVEISLADSRLTERYDLLAVHRWIKQEVDALGAKIIARSQRNGLPAIGFRFDDALVFLQGCLALRKGVLPPDVVRQLRDMGRNETAQEREAARLERALSLLRPMRHQAVIDLVRKAGIDVSKWYKRADGTAAIMPRSNPAYCYNWAFGGGKEPSIGCFWFPRESRTPNFEALTLFLKVQPV